MNRVESKELKVDAQSMKVDPRIDSPDVKVIYPSPVEELARETIQLGKADTVAEEPTVITANETQEQTPEKKEDHVCKVDIQEAIKQNLAGFIVLVVLAFGIGYLFGSRGTAGK